jgi:uroporphyrinogen decarboxylase
MNDRERFAATFSFKEVDRFYRRDCGYWPSTLKRWLQEGLPSNWREVNFFGFDKEAFDTTVLGYCDSPFDPPFEEVILREDSTTRVRRDKNGITVRELRQDPDMSMPLWLEHPVEDREGWERIMWRLEPESKGRLAKLKDAAEKVGGKGYREYPAILGIAGGFMHMRNMIGVKGLCTTIYKDPDLIHEMMDNWLKLNTAVLDRALDLVDFDVIEIAEDICYKKGLLISTKNYNEFLAPYYKELSDFLRIHDVKMMYDSDGNVKQLVPLLIEWGCDGLEPFEVQAGNDVGEIRGQYGKKLVISGGIDKRLLSEDCAGMGGEVRRILSCFSDKEGYIPMIDHTIPPNVPLRNYLHFTALLRNPSNHITVNSTTT